MTFEQYDRQSRQMVDDLWSQQTAAAYQAQQQNAAVAHEYAIFKARQAAKRQPVADQIEDMMEVSPGIFEPVKRITA